MQQEKRWLIGENIEMVIKEVEPNYLEGIRRLRPTQIFSYFYSLSSHTRQFLEEGLRRLIRDKSPKSE